MFSKTARSFFPFLLLVILALSGCTPVGKSVVWKQEKVDFSEFDTFFIRPAFNETGKPLDEKPLAQLTAYLKESFTAKKLMITDDPEAKSRVLSIQSAILVYETKKGSGNRQYWSSGIRTAECTIRTRLIDKSNDRVVGEIVTAKAAGFGSLYSLDPYKKILQVAAGEIAENVGGIIQGENRNR